MPRQIKFLVFLAVMIGTALDGANAVPSQNQPHFSISVSGGSYPVVDGSTDLPDGTFLSVTLKKPWLPDGAQRLARGLAACGEDCLPAEVGPDHLFGTNGPVQNGRFRAGPFSFKGQPIPPGTYPLEISLSADLKRATPEEIRAIGTVVFAVTVKIRANGEIYRSTPVAALRTAPDDNYPAPPAAAAPAQSGLAEADGISDASQLRTKPVKSGHATLLWPASDDQGLLSDLLGVGFKLPGLVLMTTKSEAWPLQKCAAAVFKRQTDDGLGRQGFVG